MSDCEEGSRGVVWGASPLDLPLGCSVNLGRYPSESIFTGAG